MTEPTPRPSVVTVEVGSTITKLNAFARVPASPSDPGEGVERFLCLAQGFAPTSVAQGDVGIGVQAAREDLRGRFGYDVDGLETHVNSSAAGGLRMSVHGLTAGMTARAAREASLGAGAIVGLVTAGALTARELADVAALAPTIVLLAGGVDYGERDIVVANARALAGLLASRVGGTWVPPVLYAGNVAARPEVSAAFADVGIEVLLAENVFPDVDVLNVAPLRDLIHEVFSRHIVHAPGMAALAELTSGEILPTPGAVLRAAELFADELGDVLVVDVGGATTDVHSVSDGSPELASAQVDPEPRAKRTVEGDLGVYVNARNVAQASGEPDWAQRLVDLQAMPGTAAELALTRWLTERAATVGVSRHAGRISDLYTPTGKRQVVRGKDLTAVRWVVATGGALTQIPGTADVLRRICGSTGGALLPGPDARFLVDDRYLFSALGTLAASYPQEVRASLRALALGPATPSADGRGEEG